ncbi:alpha/beta hydrolase [soil metagenome]
MQFIAARQERSFVDADGVTIHFCQWKAGKPVGIVQLSHGLGEYAARYEQLAQRLVTAGYTVYADDHRGHGQTGLDQWGGDHSKLGSLGPGGLRSTIRSIREFTALIRNETHGLPLAIIGQSWGSLMVQIVLNQHPEDYDAVVLTGTAYRTLGQMNSGDLAKSHAVPGGTGYEWLSRDEGVAHAFRDDPLTFKADVPKLFGVIDGLRLLGHPARNLAKDVPMLIQIGSEDPLGGPKSVELLAEAYLTRSKLTDVTAIVYSGARHEVFNETNRDEVIADTLAWLGGHLK